MNPTSMCVYYLKRIGHLKTVSPPIKYANAQKVSPVFVSS